MAKGKRVRAYPVTVQRAAAQAAQETRMDKDEWEAMKAANVALREKLEAAERERDALRAALGVVLDCADYTAGACGVTEMVGAVLPREVITRARGALATQPAAAGEGEPK